MPAAYLEMFFAELTTRSKSLESNSFTPLSRIIWLTPVLPIRRQAHFWVDRFLWTERVWGKGLLLEKIYIEDAVVEGSVNVGCVAGGIYSKYPLSSYKSDPVTANTVTCKNAKLFAHHNIGLFAGSTDQKFNMDTIFLSGTVVRPPYVDASSAAGNIGGLIGSFAGSPNIDTNPAASANLTNIDARLILDEQVDQDALHVGGMFGDIPSLSFSLILNKVAATVDYKKSLGVSSVNLAQLGGIAGHNYSLDASKLLIIQSMAAKFQALTPTVFHSSSAQNLSGAVGLEVGYTEYVTGNYLFSIVRNGLAIATSLGISGINSDGLPSTPATTTASDGPIPLDSNSYLDPNAANIQSVFGDAWKLDSATQTPTLVYPYDPFR